MYLLWQAACDTGRLTSTVRGRQAPRRDPPTGGGGGSGGGRRPARSGCEQSYVAQFVRAAPQLSQRPWRSTVNVPSAAAAHAATAAPLRRSARGLSAARGPERCARHLGAVEGLRQRAGACPKSPVSVRLAGEHHTLTSPSPSPEPQPEPQP